MRSCLIVAVFSLGLCATGSVVLAAETHQSRSGSSQTRISEDIARSIASERFPGSAFERAELKKKQGRLVWSIHLRPNGSNDVQEVQVDAVSGEIIAAEVETDNESDGDDDRQRDR